jgi:hypothetical protein
VTPSAATGTVTFYNGVTVLETEPLVGGQATLTTVLLAEGTGSLTAYYGGNGTYAPSTSPVLTQTVNPIAASRFSAAVEYDAGAYLYSIAVADFNGDGKPDLAVVGIEGINVLLGNGNGTFQAGVGYTAGTSPESVAVGDFNGDGIPDLAVANGGGNTVSVLLGNGDGTFQPPLNASVGAGPIFIVVGDFNQDGKADVAVANYSGSDISVLLGNGNGTFQAAVDYGTGSYPHALAIGDFIGNGKTDLAVANAGGNSVSVLLGNGDGTFQSAVSYSAGSAPQYVTVGDFRGNGHEDLAVANESGGNVSVLLGNGDGTFQSAVNYSTGTNPYAAAVGDFNGDGEPDLAIACYGSDYVDVLLGNGDGTFQPAVDYGAGSRPAALVVADFNLDGKADVATANQSSDNVSLLLGYSTVGTGTVSSTTAPEASANPSQYGHAVTLTATVSPSSATGTVTFYDGPTVLETEPTAGGQAAFTTALLPSGALSLTARYSGNAIYAPSTSAALAVNVNPVSATGFQSPESFATGNGPYAVATGDFNGDGKPDLAVANYADNTVSVLLGSGTGSFQAGSTYPVVSGPLSVAVGDFNGDGKPDLAIADYGASFTTASGNTVSVLLGNGDGTFQPAVNYGTGVGPWTVVVGDFNLDGTADLAVANANAGTVSVLLGNGDGSFQDAVSYSVGNTPDSLAVADFNGDGAPDLAVANYGSNSVSVLLGNGDGTFQAAANYNVGNGPESVAVGNFSGGTTADIAAANYSDGTVSVLIGNGSGTFSPGATYSAGSGSYALGVGDFNGDGKPDLAVANYLGNTVSILLGAGGGVFQSATNYGVGSGPISLAVADFNGDGKTDLAVANHGSNSLSLLLGEYGSSTGNNPSTTVLTSSLNPSQQGQTVTLTATVTPSAATGTVAFMNGSTNLGSSPVISGVATLTLSTLPMGSNSLTAIYGGDSTYEGSTGSLTQVVNSCVTLSPASIFLANGGGNVSVTVTASSGSCSWGLASSVSWMSAAPSSGSGSGSATVTVAPNSTGADLTGNLTLSVGGQVAATVPVTEDFTAQTFADVPPSAYYFDAVNLLAASGITAGCGSDDYCPLENVTRAQMAIFIVRAIYGSTTSFPYNQTPYFNDVPAGSFGFAWIQAMYELGITTGCGNNDFCPNSDVTRAEMSVFIIRMRYGATFNFDYPPTPYFTDVTPSTFGFSWIQRMREDNITAGCGPTTYCPNNPVTRGDMAIFIMRGAFNELLPAGESVITSINPATITPGAGPSTFTVTGLNTNWVNGITTIAAEPGITVGTVTVTGPTSLTVVLTAAGNAPANPVSVLAITPTPANEQDVLPNGLTVQ